MTGLEYRVICGFQPNEKREQIKLLLRLQQLDDNKVGSNLSLLFLVVVVGLIWCLLRISPPVWVGFIPTRVSCFAPTTPRTTSDGNESSLFRSSAFPASPKLHSPLHESSFGVLRRCGGWRRTPEMMTMMMKAKGEEEEVWVEQDKLGLSIKGKKKKKKLRRGSSSSSLFFRATPNSQIYTNGEKRKQ